MLLIKQVYWCDYLINAAGEGSQEGFFIGGPPLSMYWSHLSSCLVHESPVIVCVHTCVCVAGSGWWSPRVVAWLRAARSRDWSWFRSAARKVKSAWAGPTWRICTSPSRSLITPLSTAGSWPWPDPDLVLSCPHKPRCLPSPCPPGSLKRMPRVATVETRPQTGWLTTWGRRKPSAWCTLNLRWRQGGLWKRNIFFHNLKSVWKLCSFTVVDYKLLYFRPLYFSFSLFYCFLCQLVIVFSWDVVVVKWGWVVWRGWWIALNTVTAGGWTNLFSCFYRLLLRTLSCMLFAWKVLYKLLIKFWLIYWLIDWPTFFSLV